MAKAKKKDGEGVPLEPSDEVTTAVVTIATKRIDFDVLNKKVRQMAGDMANDIDPDTDGTYRKIAINKVQIRRGHFPYIEYHEHVTLISGGGTKRKDIGGKNQRTGENIMHDDLRNAFTRLSIHLALISEMISYQHPELTRYFDRDGMAFVNLATWLESKPIETLPDFTVVGIEINASGDNEGITLTGTKMLSTQKSIGIITPSERWQSSPYKYINELAEVIELIKYEAELYLAGKIAAPSQSEIEFAQQEEDAEQSSR